MKTKLIVLWVGAILLTGMCLFPPSPTKTAIWTCAEMKEGSYGKYRVCIGPIENLYDEKGYTNQFNFLFFPNIYDFDFVGSLTDDDVEFWRREGRGLKDGYTDYQRYSYKDHRWKVVWNTIGPINYPRLGLQFLAVFPLLGVIYFTLSQLEIKKELKELRQAVKAKKSKEENP